MIIPTNKNKTVTKYIDEIVKNGAKKAQLVAGETLNRAVCSLGLK